ncbi:heme peroxidase [Elsinoe ampelina]|uniref:Heme peroxidase n=1 Tax=Elsinoe ampelina TaxID=302913 RepID=A0A6A6G5R3_9PEZI|nr:heme peroxidase [Elsinoe ampelina]
MAPGLNLDDEVHIAEDNGLSALDDALGGARNYLLSTRIGRALNPSNGQTRRPLAIDEDTGSPERPTGLKGLVAGLAKSIPNLKPKDVLTLLKVGEAAALKDPINDKDLVMEHMIQAATHDEDGIIGGKITQTFITTLWEDLQHPPEESLAKEYRFRTANGSGNSLLHPNMGAAGQAYARTVKPKTGQPAILPDPGVLFDSLMARRKPVEHPTKISSMLFYMATIIIHDLFRTDHKNFAKSKTSSYLDLAPLYGSDETEQNLMRTRRDGKLKPDCFSETRLLMLPPGSGILLIMFNRFHNHIAEGLVAINENQRFKQPLTDDIESNEYKTYDEEVFQTARLITCGLYVNIILLDYVGTILNLNRTESDWQLDPRVEVPDGPAMGVGNQVSAEFNLVYRWHATVSARDDEWTQNEFAKLFPGKKIEDVDQKTFLATLGRKEAELSAKNPEDRDFLDLARQQNGYFNDEELVASLISSVDDVANAYGPRNVPIALKAVEVLGIQQARAWNLATLNEFRKHFSLRPYEKFEEITEDKETVEHLKHLYKHPDHVELYPGLVVEDAKDPMVPGAGLCPSYTVSRAILADAVTLVRGDRFFTTSYHPKILTNWGWAEGWYDLDVNKGCVLYKLFQRSFPNHFHPDSIYSHYPFTISKEVRSIFQNELTRRAPLYNMDVATAAPPSQQITISTNAAAASVLADTDTFSIDLSLAVKLLTPSQRSNKALIASLGKHLLSGPSAHLSINDSLLISLCDSFERDLYEHIKKKSHALPKFSEINIISDVINRCTVRLAATLFSIPVQSKPGDSSSPVSEKDLAFIFSTLTGSWSAFDIPTNVAQRQKSSRLVNSLRAHMLSSLKSQTQTLLHSTPKYDRTSSDLTRYRTDVLSALVRSLPNASSSDLADAAFSTLLILAASLSTTVTTRFSESLDLALSLPDSKHLSTIRSLAAQETYAADKGFNAYAHELARLSSTTVAPRTATRPTTLPTSPGSTSTVQLAKGDRVLLSSALINRDVPDADKLILNREGHHLPVDLTFGAKDKVWQELHQACLRSLLKVVCGLKGLRAGTVWDGTSVASRVKKIGVRGAAQDRGLGAGAATGSGVKGKGAKGVSGAAQGVNGTNGTSAAGKGKEVKADGDRDVVAQWAFLTPGWEGLSVVPTSLVVDYDLGQ